MGIDRKENFTRIAEARTNKIIHLISLLGNLSNRSYYDYSTSDIEAIFGAIQKELDMQRGKFGATGSIDRKFRL